MDNTSPLDHELRITIEDTKHPIRTTKNKILEVALGIIHGLKEHVLTVSPWYLSGVVNFRILSYSFLALNLTTCFEVFEGNHSKTARVVYALALFTNLIAITDILGFTVQDVRYRLAIDTLLVLSASIGSICSFRKGVCKVQNAITKKENTTSEKVANLVSGIVIAILATSTLFAIHLSVKKYFAGWKIFSEKDLNQQDLLVKHRSISTLDQQKSCRAVVIDGVSSQWSDNSIKKIDDVPMPLVEAVYRECKTLSYHVHSPFQYCKALREARQLFGHPIDVLLAGGHANNQVQVLGREYLFDGKGEEVSCMDDYLKKDAQIILFGCNTATKTKKVKIPLAEKLSRSLKNQEVTGFKAFAHPFFLTVNYDGRFKIGHYFPYTLNGWTMENTASTYREGVIQKLNDA